MLARQRPRRPVRALRGGVGAARASRPASTRSSSARSISPATSTRPRPARTRGSRRASPTPRSSHRARPSGPAPSARPSVHERPGRRDLPVLGRRDAVRASARRRSSPARSSKRASTSSRSARSTSTATSTASRSWTRRRRRTSGRSRTSKEPDTSIVSMTELGPDDLVEPNSVRFEFSGSDNRTSRFELDVRVLARLRRDVGELRGDPLRGQGRPRDRRVHGSRSARSTRSATSTRRPAVSDEFVVEAAPDVAITASRRASLLATPETDTTTVSFAVLVHQPERDLRVLARPRRAVRALRLGRHLRERPVRRARVRRPGGRPARHALARARRLHVGERNARSAAGDDPERADGGRRRHHASPRPRRSRSRRTGPGRTCASCARSTTCRRPSATRRRRTRTSSPASSTRSRSRRPSSTSSSRPTPREWTWTIGDVAPPVTEFVNPLPPNPSSENVTFHFTGVDNGTPTIDLDFQCTLDGPGIEIPETVGCSSPFELQNLTRRRAHVHGQRDRRGRAHRRDPRELHVERRRACRSRVITGPVEPGGTSTSADATLSFFDQPGSTYVCRFDPVARACRDAVRRRARRPSTSRPHQRHARASRCARRPASESPRNPPAEYEWTVDAIDEIAPDTTIDLGPADGSTSTNTTETFVFSGTDNLTAALELAFECRLDSDLETAWQDCEPGYQLRRAHPRRAHVRGPRDRPRRQHRQLAREPHVDARGRSEQHVRRRADPVELTLPIQGGGTATVTFAEVTRRRPHDRDRAHGRADAARPATSPTGAVYYDVSTTATYVGDITALPPVRPGLARRASPPALRRQRVGRGHDVDRPGERHRLRAHRRPLAVRDRRGEPALAPTTAILEGPETRLVETAPGIADGHASPSARATRWPSSSARSTASRGARATTRTRSTPRSARTRCSSARRARTARST